MEKKSKKYDDILIAAKKLFFKYGIKKVTIEDVCKEANVSKMTFYKFFPNKTALAKEIVNGFYQEEIQQFSEIFDPHELSVEERLKKWLEFKNKSLKNAGKEFIMDVFKNTDEELISYLEEKTQEANEISKNFIIKAQNDGWIRKEFDPVLLMVIIDKMNDVTSDELVLDIYGENVYKVSYDVTKLLLCGILVDSSKLCEELGE